MEKEWKDITNYFSEKQRHYNGKYLVVDYILDEEIEVQLYEVEEEWFDYEYEIFVNSDPFYGSTYQDKDFYEMIEATKKDIYEESFKKINIIKNLLMPLLKSMILA